MTKNRGTTAAPFPRGVGYKVGLRTSGMSVSMVSQLQTLSVFKKTVSAISKQYGDDQRLSILLRDMFQLQDDVVTCLSRSGKWRIELFELASNAGMVEQPYIREAFHEDEVQLVALFHQALSRYEANILSLQGDNALGFLNALRDFLSRGLLYNDSTKAHHLLLKLSKSSGLIPSTLVIEGVALEDHKPVGRGGFSVVYRGRWRGAEVALKCLSIRLAQEPEKGRQIFIKEALIWQSLSHPNILPFLGIDATTFPSSLSLVSPWMDQGTILDFFNRYGASHTMLPKFVKQVAKALLYLHSMSIAHGDLKALNVLLDDQWNAVLTDFGISILMVATTSLSASRACTVTSTAPELINPAAFKHKRAKKTPATDVYAFACLCVELYTGLPPFHPAADTEVMFQVAVQGARPARPDNVPTELWDIITLCWPQNPDQRLKMSKVVEMLDKLPAFKNH